jgi:hypothetical protein
MLALEEWRVEDVCGGVFCWRERGWFGGYFGEDVEVLCHLEGFCLERVREGFTYWGETYVGA